MKIWHGLKINYFLTIVIACVKKGFFVNPFLLYSQAYHETGNFTSNIFKHNKNLFGMKKATVRDTTAIGEASGHATYNSLSDSVIDYILRQRDFKIKPRLFNDNQYMLDTLNSNYAEDTNYLSKWQNIHKTLQDNNKIIAIIIVFVPFASIVLLSIFLYKKYVN
ncbi:glucosaminidase domain-containing protein [Corallibacter sp.]|uniref:glucosaminidase domain-containing protein n=1 Tax=Corallibacter sp. TaxID=2038084 RepID=UPI003A93DA30